MRNGIPTETVGEGEVVVASMLEKAVYAMCKVSGICGFRKMTINSFFYDFRESPYSSGNNGLTEHQGSLYQSALRCPNVWANDTLGLFHEIHKFGIVDETVDDNKLTVVSHLLQNGVVTTSCNDNPDIVIT